jgi:hypothetical protein
MLLKPEGWLKWSSASLLEYGSMLNGLKAGLSQLGMCEYTCHSGGCNG